MSGTIILLSGVLALFSAALSSRPSVYRTWRSSLACFLFLDRLSGAPFGAIVFGHLGDLIRPQIHLSLTLLRMSRRPSWSACCRAMRHRHPGA